MAALSRRFHQQSIVINDTHQIRVIDNGSGRVLETIPGADLESLSRAYGRWVLGKSNPFRFIGFWHFDGLFAKWGAAACALHLPLTTSEMFAVKGRRGEIGNAIDFKLSDQAKTTPPRIRDD